MVRVPQTALPQRAGSRVQAEREKNALTHYCVDEHVQFQPLRDHFATRPSLEVFDVECGGESSAAR
jgi:hypothetical protein